MRFFRWSTLLALMVVPPTLANDDWWFDVEVIVFDRNLDLSTLNEQFETLDNLAPPITDADIISQVITPDISWLKQGLSVCETNEPNDEPFLYEIPEIPDVQLQNQDDLERTSQVDFINRDTPASQASIDDLNVEVPPLQAEAENAFQPPSVEQIARYWIDSLNLKDDSVITVPQFSYCEPPSPWLSYEHNAWHIHHPDNRLPVPEELPITPEGNDWPAATHAHLLTKEQQHLTGLSRQIRQASNLTRLLHITWRQPVKFGKDNAFNVRIFGGNNFANEFTLDGKQRIDVAARSDEKNSPRVGDSTEVAQITLENPASLNQNNSIANSTAKDQNNDGETSYSDNFFKQLTQRLTSASPISFDELIALDSQPVIDDGDDTLVSKALRTPIWQIDGNMKVFLKYINNVPYLHIDNRLFYRQPIPLQTDNHELVTRHNDTQPVEKYRLVSIPFHEQRRVISKQLHYFDHPLFGMVVQIRRYKRPTPETLNAGESE